MQSLSIDFVTVSWLRIMEVLNQNICRIITKPINAFMENSSRDTDYQTHDTNCQ